MLDRPRHAEIIARLREVGARVYLITDGDVAGVINTAEPQTGVDHYIGQGGAPEGVLACAALKCVGGQFQSKLVFRNADERGRAERLGLTDFDKVYQLNEIVPRRRHLRGHRRDGRRVAGWGASGAWLRTHALLGDELSQPDCARGADEATRLKWRPRPEQRFSALSSR